MGAATVCVRDGWFSQRHRGKGGIWYVEGPGRGEGRVGGAYAGVEVAFGSHCGGGGGGLWNRGSCSLAHVAQASLSGPEQMPKDICCRRGVQRSSFRSFGKMHASVPKSWEVFVDSDLSRRLQKTFARLNCLAIRMLIIIGVFTLR